MLTLAEIEDLDLTTNLCRIRVPILEAAGNKKKVTMIATMMLPPGIHGGYMPGDVVFVTFVDNSFNRPVVLGQLYRGASKGNAIDSIGSTADTLDTATALSCVNLSATGHVSLPASTEFEIQNVTEKNGTKITLTELWGRLETLEQDYQNLLERIEALEKAQP